MEMLKDYALRWVTSGMEKDHSYERIPRGCFSVELRSFEGFFLSVQTWHILQHWMWGRFCFPLPCQHCSKTGRMRLQLVSSEIGIQDRNSDFEKSEFILWNRKTEKTRYVHISFIDIPSYQASNKHTFLEFHGSNFFHECFIGNRSKVWRCSYPVILNSWRWQHIVSVLWRRVPWNAIWRKAFCKGIPVDGWSLVNQLIILFVAVFAGSSWTFSMRNAGFQPWGVETSIYDSCDNEMKTFVNYPSSYWRWTCP